MANKLDLLYEGKAKRVFKTSDRDALWLEFKDDTTAFDGQKMEILDDKGILNAAISTHLLQVLEKNGVPTHYISTISPREMMVKKLKMLPVEFVIRNYSAGSFSKRMGIKEGVPLKSPVLEFYYKDDALHDPMINEYIIEALELAEKDEVLTAKEYCWDVNDILSYEFRDVGITLVDFKIEFGIDNDGQVVLADEISPDSCRLWDEETGDKMDKDRFRRDLGGVIEAYREVLGRLQSDQQ
jgi:phosphoribosylaminoimidazole-succinocarboxamide synthase